MTQPSCGSPIPLVMLVEYWLGELDEIRETAIDEHLLSCGHCTANLQGLVDLTGGIHMAIRAGPVRAALTDGYLKRLAAQGLRLRDYRVSHNVSMCCTVAPDDDLLITRLEAPLAGVERLDVEYLAGEVRYAERLRDVPFDATEGEVIMASPIEFVHAPPASTVLVRLLSVAPDERLIGEYTLRAPRLPRTYASGHGESRLTLGALAASIFRFPYSWITPSVLCDERQSVQRGSPDQAGRAIARAALVFAAARAPSFGESRIRTSRPASSQLTVAKAVEFQREHLLSDMRVGASRSAEAA